MILKWLRISTGDYTLIAFYLTLICFCYAICKLFSFSFLPSMSVNNFEIFNYLIVKIILIHEPSLQRKEV